jgi:hypothetical protein
MFVEIFPKQFENYNHVLSERETICDSDYARAISRIQLLNGCKYLVLNRCIINIKLLVSADLYGNLFTPILNVEALNDLPECALVDNVRYEVAIPDLFANSGPVVALSVNDLSERLASIAAHSIDLFKL